MKLNRYLTAAALSLGLALATASDAFADIKLIKITPSNSWIATVSVDTTFDSGAVVKVWDRMVVTNVNPSSLSPNQPPGAPFPASPNTLEPPVALDGFSVGGWAQVGVATTATATATAALPILDINQLQFDIHFTGLAVNGGAVRFDFFNGAELVAIGWLYAVETAPNQVGESHFLTYHVVPLPKSALAGGILLVGALGFGMVRRRRQSAALTA